MACINPINIRSPLGSEDLRRSIYVPCGKCAWCLKQKRDEWYIRFKMEQQDNEFTKFITLTYSDDNLPFYLDEETGEYGYRANKKDIQKFIKRMRKAGYKFKYFLVSEYAPKTRRPHYHALFFTNDNITDEDVRKSWQKGVTDTQEADDGALKYVTKYILKGSDRDGNFKLQSTRPAIGSGYIKKAIAEQCYRETEDGTKTFTFPINGNLHKMPRYFVKKFAQFFDEDEFKFNKIKIIKNMEQRGKHYYLEKIYNKHDDNTKTELENTQHFLSSIRNKYNRDVKTQVEINNKEFIDYV